MPERVKDPVSVICCVQIVVKKPADGLPLLSLGVITRGAHSGVPADEVVKAELTVGGLSQR
jgi:hypothetical protein